MEKTSQSQHEAWMREAIALAKKAADLGEVPVGAVVVQNNRIVGSGFNQPISSQDPTAHAEVVALRNAARAVQSYRLTQCTLYVTIEPCTMCAGALVHARIAHLVYGATEPKAGVVESHGCLLNGDNMNHKVTFCGGILATECGDQLRYFFKNNR